MGSGLSAEQRELLDQTGFTAKELKALRKEVQKLSGQKKGGQINVTQFKTLFRKRLSSTGRALVRSDAGKQVDLEEVFVSVDSNVDGLVTLEELVLWLGIFKKGTAEAKLKHLFHSFDLDENGTLEADELTNVISVLQVSLENREDNPLSVSKCAKKAKRLVQKLNADGKPVTLEQWLKVGQETNLVEELLGPHFISVMESLKI